MTIINTILNAPTLQLFVIVFLAIILQRTGVVDFHQLFISLFSKNGKNGNGTEALLKELTTLKENHMAHIEGKIDNLNEKLSEFIVEQKLHHQKVETLLDNINKKHE